MAKPRSDEITKNELIPRASAREISGGKTMKPKTNSGPAMITPIAMLKPHST